MKKVIAIAALLAVAAGINTAYAQEQGNAAREYVVSEFVQSVGRNRITADDNALAGFSDADSIDEQYKEDFKKAVTKRIVDGYEDNTLRPKNDISRIEAMVILSRCVGDVNAVRDAVEFTDVPDWAKKDIDKLSSAGLVEGYGDGILGSEDRITKEQVSLLTGRTDEILNESDVKNSFYDYINDKSFRNCDLGSSTIVDSVHGSIITTENSWSHILDMYKDIVGKEQDMLKNLMDGKLNYEKGSAAQRIYDMLVCIDTAGEDKPADKALFNSYRKRILDAGSLSELIKTSDEIYKETGVNVLFEVTAMQDEATNRVYPAIDIKSAGMGSMISFSSEAKRKYSNQYKELIKDYIKCCGLDVSDKAIEKAYELQELSGEDDNYAMYYIMGNVLRIYSDTDYTEEMADKSLGKLLDEHPEIDSETMELKTPQKPQILTLEEADSKIDTVKVAERLKNIGFNNFDKVIFTERNGIMAGKDIFKADNLEALKINALLVLGDEMKCADTAEEMALLEEFDSLETAVLTGVDMNGLKDDSTDEGEEDILSQSNLLKLLECLPDDIGLMYCDYYYDDAKSEDAAQIVRDIWKAYSDRLENNTWLSEKARKNALKKLEDMMAVIGYPDNYNFPDIQAVFDGGTYFNNIIKIKQNELQTTIHKCADPEFIRTIMAMPADTINVRYMPSINCINIYAGILNSPAYDENASYAANLGGIGAIIAHEIAHSFDIEGSFYDENGLSKQIWTDEDYDAFNRKRQEFIDYYKKFYDGSAEKAEENINEDMADIVGIQCIFDILGDNSEAKKEALEAFASIWAHEGKETYLAEGVFMQDVHPLGKTRVDACVSAFDEFYEFYDVKEGDFMYTAPENRPKLW